MSADNWAICPQCKLKPNPYHEKLDKTLREDYEIGIYGGEFFISYMGHCDKCDFTKLFKHSEKLELKEPS